MQIVRTLPRLRRLLALARKRGKRIGFVPTLGALHEGHASLIRTARRENDLVVVSLFVNPTQFDRTEDYRSYPRTLRQDRRLAARNAADLLFLPSERAIYPAGFQTWVEVQDLSRPWEGRFRPGHFRGVATVVTKLLNLVQPDRAYFGQKDAQQARIVAQLIRDLGIPVRLRVLPTVRERDGLAMSSRNRHLSPRERLLARRIFPSLHDGRRLIEWGCRRRTLVARRVTQRLRAIPGARIEYVAVVDPATLEEPDEIRGTVWILAALWIGRTRLIDCCIARPGRERRRG